MHDEKNVPKNSLWKFKHCCEIRVAIDKRRNLYRARRLRLPACETDSLTLDCWSGVDNVCLSFWPLYGSNGIGSVDENARNSELTRFDSRKWRGRCAPFCPNQPSSIPSESGGWKTNIYFCSIAQHKGGILCWEMLHDISSPSRFYTVVFTLERMEAL